MQHLERLLDSDPNHRIKLLGKVLSLSCQQTQCNQINAFVSRYSLICNMSCFSDPDLDLDIIMLI